MRKKEKRKERGKTEENMTYSNLDHGVFSKQKLRSRAQDSCNISTACKSAGKRWETCWQSGPWTPSLQDFASAAQNRTNTILNERIETHNQPKYVEKQHILDALEVQAPALAGVSPSCFWAQGQRLLDVGAGSGELALYLQEKYAVNATAFDVVEASQNAYALKHEALKIHVFDGRSLPLTEKSFEVVMINSVLHHAAKNAVSLVHEAVRVANKYVVVLEDLGKPVDVSMKKMVAPYEKNVALRNRAHDKHGIFRTLDEWYSIFNATPGVASVRHDMLCKHMPDKGLPCESFKVPHKYFYVIFVIAVDAPN